MELWPWQQRGIDEVIKLLKAGELSICLTAPTGMGKGLIIEKLAMFFINQGGNAILLTNRKMLTRQTGDRFVAAGIQFGYASAEFGICTSLPLTVASVQTIASRVKRKKMELPKSDLVIVDEAHNRGFDSVMDDYKKTYPGTAFVGLTATPVGLKGKYDRLVLCGTKKEGRSHQALVPCLVFAPSEPNMQGVAMTQIGEYVHKGMVKRVMQCTCYADIHTAWEKHALIEEVGPVRYRPTLLWAPGVPESRGLVEPFGASGISAEHVDGDTSESDRERIMHGSRDGSISIVSSFGVLREGVDWPWISYGIMVQVCGAIETFLQMVGRILRAYPGKDNAILQDHSGTWWRHGSPNEDIDWTLGDTSKSLAKSRKKKIQAGEKAEGICCPKCAGIRAAGPKCPHCGYEHTRSVRMIRFENGELVKMTGPVVKRKKQVSTAQKNWMSCLYACSRKTLDNARAMYHRRTNVWPTADLKPFPNPDDWNRQVSDAFPFIRPRGSRR